MKTRHLVSLVTGMTLPQYGHVAMKPQIVLRGQPCAVTIFGNAHRRGGKGGLAGLFQRGGEWAGGFGRAAPCS